MCSEFSEQLLTDYITVRMGSGRILGAVHAFVLQRGEERLSHGVVVIAHRPPDHRFGVAVDVISPDHLVSWRVGSEVARRMGSLDAFSRTGRDGSVLREPSDAPLSAFKSDNILQISGQVNFPVMYNTSG